MHIQIYQIVYINYVTFLYTNYASIKLVENNTGDGGIECWRSWAMRKLCVVPELEVSHDAGPGC